MNSKILMGFALSTLSATLAPSVSGADFDGSKPLICAPVQAMECYAGEA